MYIRNVLFSDVVSSFIYAVRVHNYAHIGNYGVVRYEHFCFSNARELDGAAEIRLFSDSVLQTMPDLALINEDQH